MNRSYLLVFVFLILGAFSSLEASDLVLAWDRSTSSGVTGYRIYWGESSRNYSNNAMVGNPTTYKVIGLTSGKAYYFTVTAYNSSGLESDYSNEVFYRVPNGGDPGHDGGPEGGSGNTDPGSGGGTPINTNSPGTETPSNPGVDGSTNPSGPIQQNPPGVLSSLPDSQPIQIKNGEVLILDEAFSHNYRPCYYNCSGPHWKVFGKPTWGVVTEQDENLLWSFGSSQRRFGRDLKYRSPDSWAVYGPFDLSDAKEGTLSFDYNFEKEKTSDRASSKGERFGYYLSTDGSNFTGWMHLDAESGGWQNISRNFSNWGSLGDVTGRSRVWVGFRFKGDVDGVEGFGVVIDNIRIKKELYPAYRRPVLVVPWMFEGNNRTTEITLSNPGDSKFKGTLIFRSVDGLSKEFSVLNGDKRAVRVEIPSHSYKRWATDNSSPSNEGYGIIISDYPGSHIYGGLTYKIGSKRISSILSEPSLQYHCQGNHLQFWDSFIVLVNPGLEPANIRIGFRSEDGSVSEENEIIVPARVLKKEYLKDLLTPVDFPGSVYLTGNHQFNMVSFIENPEGKLETLTCFPTAFYPDEFFDSGKDEINGHIVKDKASPIRE